jgi:hypothetical protein
MDSPLLRATVTRSRCGDARIEEVAQVVGRLDQDFQNCLSNDWHVLHR